MRSLATILFALLLPLLAPLQSNAEISEAVKQDFTSAAGYIIMPVADEFLVDLDASVQLQEGDILTVLMQGEQVVHPVTKAILGTLEIPKAFLQVTRIKSGYSYAKQLSATSAPQKGDKVKRYEQVPTRFDNPSDNNQLYLELKNSLAQLNWLPENSSTPPLLTFVLESNRLTVKDANGVVVKRYQVEDGRVLAQPGQYAANKAFISPLSTKKNEGFLDKTVNTLLDSVGLDTRPDTITGPAIIRNPEQMKRQGIWMSQNLEAEPVGISTGDFDNDGILETAVAMNNQLLIGQITDDSFKQEHELAIPTGTSLLSLDSIDLDKDGIPELCLTAAKDFRLTSMLVAFTGSGYQVIENNIPWFLRVVTLPGYGKVLLAQSTGDQNSHFSGKPFFTSFIDGKLEKGEELTIPARINVFSFLQTTSFITYLTQGDYLKVITPSGQELWESGDYFGGSEATFYNTEDKDGDIIEPIYIQQRVILSPDGEILVAQNNGVRTLKRFRNFKSSSVVALKWDGFSMSEIWRTAQQNGYLADFTIGDADNDGADELVMAITFQRSNIVQKARSSIVTYELN